MAVKRLLIRYVYLDGRSAEYPVTPKQQMTFERIYKISFSAVDENITNRYQLAWFIQKEHQSEMPEGFMPTLDDWLDTLDAIEVDSEEVRPFGPVAPANGSLPSASLPVSLPGSS